MKIAYRKTGWRATDVRFVDKDYTPIPSEFIIDGETLPDPETLSDPDPTPPIDQSDIDNLQKQMKALALCIAQVGGLTVPQIKTMFKNKMDSLP